MTITTPTDAGAVAPASPPVPLVTFRIDEFEVAVPKGTLVIRAAEQVGIQIPRFCDHPLLAPAGACRQCLVEVAMPDREGNLRPMPKPQASCTLEATPGMVVKTQRSSAIADKAQHGVMEFLLINHPLDCPVCDKGGECPLQNQAMSNGRATSRFVDVKRTFPKPISISTEILLDRERCVLCQRCTRFQQQIAGDPFIDLQNRGAIQQIGRFAPDVLGFSGSGSGAADPATVGPAALDESGQPFASYFSGNTIQICPVGALTNASYRFRSRPYDLISTPGVGEHDSSGSAIRVDHRRGVVVRRLAGNEPDVNEEWITDKDRFAYTWQSAADRITTPLVRDETTRELRAASWAEALDVAAAGLAALRHPSYFAANAAFSLGPVLDAATGPHLITTTLIDLAYEHCYKTPYSWPELRDIPAFPSESNKWKLWDWPDHVIKKDLSNAAFRIMTPEPFYRIGHSFFALLAALAGGHFAVVIARVSAANEPQSPSTPDLS